MKKLVLSAVVILVFMGYVVYQKDSTFISTLPGDGNSTDTPPPITQGQYKDGTYLGDVADAIFGLMQVKAIIVGGKLTDVEYVKVPYDKPTTIQIQDAAMPIWKAQAISLQSANVDIVSGATQSTEGFQKTLASALNKAKI
jgi:uncharacterized protein with FMN-binding domain